jgi:hypothetical protein
MQRILIVLVGLWAATAGAAVRADQRLADYRRVVVADKPGAVQKVAAEELARYVGHITGHPLEVIPAGQFAEKADGLSFFVGDAVAAGVLRLDLGPWKDEEWLLRTVPRGLLLAGQDGEGDPWSLRTPAGSLLATYTLLDDYLGVRWFWPGPFGEHVPNQPTATVPTLDVRTTPPFIIRSVSFGYPRYHTAAFRDETRKWARRTRQGWVYSAVFGHSWNNAFHLKEGTDFKEHPDWFALVNGQRRPPQMCTTHPDVIDRMVEFVLNGKTRIVNISPSDGGGFCQCDEHTKSVTHQRLGIPSCTSLDVPGRLSYDGKTVQLSDRIFAYANEVARRVRQRDPGKGVGMFAYTFYNRPPVKIQALEPNLYLSFVYQCAAHRDPDNLKEWRASVEGWQKLGGKLVAREAWGNHYYLDLPFVHHEWIIKNLSEAHRRGFLAAYGDGSKCFATMAPNYWALTRMMWDPPRDTGGLMDDFYAAAYGPVAKEMKAFFETYHAALDSNWDKRRRAVDTTAIAYANLIGSWHLLLPPAAVERAEAHLRAAEKKAPTGEYAERVKFHRFGQDYTRCMLELLDHYRRLTELGVKLQFSTPTGKDVRDTPADRPRLLQRAYELGEQREKLLLAHRDWAGPDEGLYAFANDMGLRQWHAAVKRGLGIDRLSAVTREKLRPE